MLWLLVVLMLMLLLRGRAVVADELTQKVCRDRVEDTRDGGGDPRNDLVTLIRSAEKVQRHRNPSYGDVELGLPAASSVVVQSSPAGGKKLLCMTAAALVLSAIGLGLVIELAVMSDRVPTGISGQVRGQEIAALQQSAELQQAKLEQERGHLIRLQTKFAQLQTDFRLSVEAHEDTSDEHESVHGSIHVAVDKNDNDNDNDNDDNDNDTIHQLAAIGEQVVRAQEVVHLNTAPPDDEAINRAQAKPHPQWLATLLIRSKYRPSSRH